ncbi:hypothetical protein Caci_8214 [Catenulispora acidiphila DSM 44928]|uniref:Uncharacterized protein n=1 Tax=Catenulispora acidiphila (strain DSM 44928 / JCM 14897 / NBRC 102108 / NRRL B-24433 / ID139908) TaxID=479433 RepID=C7QIY7_CATAD|nr:hypothetical protein Caci_8214 [Catenulispora acidiphila DSM 44928]
MTGAFSAFLCPAGLRASQRVDIDGAGGVDVPDREPMTGPLGVLLCGGGGAAVVGFGAVVGCG